MMNVLGAANLLTPGSKFDDDKPRMDLIPVSLMNDVAKVLTYGANKYADRNWETGILWGRVYAAALRHLFAWWGGEDIDPESGLPHLAHATCELAFLIEFAKTHPELDNRPTVKAKNFGVAAQYVPEARHV